MSYLCAGKQFQTLGEAKTYADFIHKISRVIAAIEKVEQPTMSRYEIMRKNNGEPPHQITKERFFEMLEVLPPGNWTRRKGSESFMVIECETANLYTWCARIGNKYFEMIAPNDCTHGEILNIIVMHLGEEDHAN